MKNKILNVILIGYIIVLIWLLLVPNVFRGEQTWYNNVYLLLKEWKYKHRYTNKKCIGKFFHVYANYNFNKNKDPSVDFKKDFIIYYLF